MPGCILASKVVSVWFRKRRRGLPHGTMLRPSTSSGRRTARSKRSGRPIPGFQYRGRLRPTRRERLRPTRLRHQFIELRGNAMAASSDDTRSASRSDRRKPAEPRGSATTASSDDTRSAPRGDPRNPASASHYMIAPATLGMTRQALVDRLNQMGNVEILRNYAERDAISPPLAVVRTYDENPAALRRSTAGAFVIEPDRYLRAASFAGTSSPFHAMAAMTA